MPSSAFKKELFRSDRKSTRLNSSHLVISYHVFCLKASICPRGGSLSGGHFVPLCPNDKQTVRGISLKLGNPDSMVPEQLLNHGEGEVATLQMDYFWRPTQTIAEFDEIGIRGNHRVAVLLGPCP